MCPTIGIYNLWSDPLYSSCFKWLSGCNCFVTRPLYITDTTKFYINIATLNLYTEMYTKNLSLLCKKQKSKYGKAINDLLHCHWTTSSASSSMTPPSVHIQTGEYFGLLTYGLLSRFTCRFKCIESQSTVSGPRSSQSLPWLHSSLKGQLLSGSVAGCLIPAQLNDLILYGRV